MAVGNARTAARIRLFVDHDAELRRFGANAAANLCGVFADHGGEHERVEATETATKEPSSRVIR